MTAPRRRRGSSTRTRRSSLGQTPTGKPCKDCGSGTRKTYPPGPRCATCARERRTEVSAGRRLAYVAVQYNLTAEQYQALVQHSEGLCYICGTRKGRAVDHDHSCCSGKVSCGKCVRGLACSLCNKYMGVIRDDPSVAIKMAHYLRNPPAEKILGRPHSGARR